MFDLTTLDYIYIGITLVSTVWATIRGGVYETVATISWIAAALAARFISPWLGDLFQKWFGLAEPTIGTLVSSYFLVFFIILVLFSLVNHKLRDKVQESVLKVTDHALGVIFGIVRGIVLMGLLYWGALWYYSDAERLPDYVANARTRPVMQLTAVKLHDWFVPGEAKLLERDMRGAEEAKKIYENLINPAVNSDKATKEPDAPAATGGTVAPATDTPAEKQEDTGYKSSERTALENQLLQIEGSAEE